MSHSLMKGCVVRTGRLLIKHWHDFNLNEHKQPFSLAETVCNILTENVTKTLPTTWHGKYSLERANSWIEERDADSPTLLVVEKETKDPIGFITVFEDSEEYSNGLLDIKLGYMLAETAWGKGFASELVSGFVSWCREQPSICSVTGGVGRDNPASARVLEKNGFQLLNDNPASDEVMFRNKLR